MPEKGYNLSKLPDGNLEVKFDTGEVFSGDPLDVTAKLAESRLTARSERDQWRLKAETTQQSNSTSAGTAQPAIDPNEKATQDWLAKNTVAGLGLGTPEEVKNQWDQFKQFQEQAQTNMAVTQFYQMHPEYPGSQAAHDAIGKIMDERGWAINADNFEAAHLIAIQKKLYEPVQVDNGNYSQSRATAPPMLRSNNPEVGSGGSDPYAMPMDQLRAQAIRQQLEPKR